MAWLLPNLGEPGQRFEVLERLGVGTFGEVYLALDRERGQQVALKLLRRATPTAPQAVMSKENSSHAARPPTTAQPATIWARRLMAATELAIMLPITTPMPTMANGIAVSPTLNPCSLIRYAAR